MGPESDPAGIEGMDPIEALQQIMDTGSTFVSRDDNSDTNTKELELWERDKRFSKDTRSQQHSGITRCRQRELLWDASCNNIYIQPGDRRAGSCADGGR